MTTFVALLKGVNVGKAKRVPIAKLRELLLRLGYTDVSTVLNSGNAVFQAAWGTAAWHAADIAAAISAELHLAVPVIVITARDLAGVVSQNPFSTSAEVPSQLLVAFVQDAKSLAGLAAVGSFAIPPERFAVGSGAAYLLCANGIHGSKAGEALLGGTGKAATTRNWSTVLKLHVLAGARAS